MTEKIGWRIKKKNSGTCLVQVSDKRDPLLQEALRELARRETEVTGRRISVSTILSNLATRNGAFAVSKRAELHIQLKKEQKHDSRREPNA